MELALATARRGDPVVRRRRHDGSSRNLEAALMRLGRAAFGLCPMAIMI